jgi:hypothetical protein
MMARLDVAPADQLRMPPTTNGSAADDTIRTRRMVNGQPDAVETTQKF